MKPDWPIVEIEWMDAHSAGAAEVWQDFDHINNATEGGKPCYTVGYMIKRNNDAVSVCGSVAFEKDKPDLASGTLIIPRAMIRSIRRLK